MKNKYKNIEIKSNEINKGSNILIPFVLLIKLCPIKPISEGDELIERKKISQIK